MAAEPSPTTGRFPHDAQSAQEATCPVSPHAAECRATPRAWLRGTQRCDGPLLAAHGFEAATIVGLVARRLATAQEKIKAGGKLVEVARVRITDAGHVALAADG
jgi:hypothetical protein